MAHHTPIRRLSCMIAAAGTAMLVIVPAGASTAQEAVAANVPASSVSLRHSGPSSGHSLTRLVETGVPTPAPHPNPDVKITSGHSLSRLVETGFQAPSPASVRRAPLGREVHPTVIEARPVAFGALAGVVLAGACAIVLRRRRTIQ